MSKKRVALMAGGGNLPLEFARAAKKSDVDLVVFKIKGETGSAIDKFGFKSYEINLTKLSEIVKFSKKEKVNKIILLGYIKHENLLKNIKFDLRTVKALMRAKDLRAASIMDQIILELAKDGIEVLPSTYLMEDMLSQKGCFTKKKPDAKAKKDIELGYVLAKKLSGADIGQTVVLKNGNVIAVEAIEGTDKCIERGAKIAGKGFVVVKTARPKQDLRFDVPVIGLKTIELIAKYKGAGIVIEQGKTFVMDKDEMVKVANKAKMFIVGK